MEGLTYCARNSFGDSFVAFEEETHPETLFETLEIRHGVVEAQQLHPPAQPPFHKQSQQSASQLCTFYSERDPSETVPQLKLVHIQSRRSSSHSSTKTPKLSLKITKRLFNCLFDQLQANPWVLWLISSEYDGLHHIMAQNTHADTYFFGSFHGAIIWTFSPATAFTRGLLISRHISSQRHSFYSLLSSYSPHLFTPYVPLMAATLSYILDYDERLSRYASDIAHVEKGTGFSSAGRDLSHLRFDVDALATWSRASSDVQINIINILRHHENCMRALGVVRETHTKVILDCPNAEYKVKVDKSMTEISASIHVLKMRATSFVSYATYLKNRAEAQITVIFALLTHEDSVSNLKAAEASVALAAATKRDSSAMKTIAVMTMAFLPATFLAALFALPVLEWEHKRNVQFDGFQLYWAIAISTTAVVFVVWALVTQRSSILNQVSKPRKRAAGGPGGKGLLVSS